MKEIAKPPNDNWFEVKYPNRKVYVKYSTKELLLEYYRTLAKMNHKKLPVGITPITFDENTNQIITA